MSSLTNQTRGVIIATALKTNLSTLEDTEIGVLGLPTADFVERHHRWERAYLVTNYLLVNPALTTALRFTIRSYGQQDVDDSLINLDIYVGYFHPV